MNKPFIIPLSDLLDKEIGSTLTFNLPIENYQFKNIDFTKDSEVTGTITNIGEHLLISFSSDAYTCLEQCSRCLTECKQITSIDAALESFSLHNPAENDFELLLQTEDTGQVLDITPLLEQELALSFHSFPLCKENCLGLCDVCGINRNQKTCDCDQLPPKDNPFSQLKSLFPSQ